MKLIDPYNIDQSVFRLLDKDWMLITAGITGHFNTMTASWGGFGNPKKDYHRMYFGKIENCWIKDENA